MISANQRLGNIRNGYPVQGKPSTTRPLLYNYNTQADEQGITIFYTPF